MNRVILIGRLTRDAELRYTANGLAVSTGSIAVSQGFGDKKKTDFFNVKCFGKTAENFANLGKKGVQIALEGNIGFNQYEKDGKQIKKLSLLYIDGDEKLCDGCDELKKCASVRSISGDVSIVCKDCLTEIIEYF